MKSRDRILFHVAASLLLIAPLSSLSAAPRYPTTNPKQITRHRYLKRLPKLSASSIQPVDSAPKLSAESGAEQAIPAARHADDNSAVQTASANIPDTASSDTTQETPTETSAVEPNESTDELVLNAAGAASSAATTTTARKESARKESATAVESKATAADTSIPAAAASTNRQTDASSTGKTVDSATSRSNDESTTKTEQHSDSSTATTTASTPQSSQQQETEPETTTKQQASTKTNTPAPTKPAPSKPARQFTSQQLRLRNKVRSCLRYYYQHRESIAEHSPWGIMHDLIGFGVDTEIIAGSRRVNAIGWLCWNQPCRGIRLLDLKDGQIVPRRGPGYQGHEGQFLSMLALSRVPISYSIRVGGEDMTVADLVKYEMLTCRPRSELSFKLIGLSHYLKSDATWTSKWGEKWSIPRLIQDEITQPINGACCGGTHRLMGLSAAVRARTKRHEPMTGQWLRAKNFVRSYQNYAFKLQNRDGSFSTDWFKRRADNGDIDRKLQTTGHILEWLVYSLPEEQLTNYRVVRSVNFLANLMISQRRHQWEIGPRGHALHALALYNERVFGDQPGQRRLILTGHTTN